jgi:dTDP-glucose 4,6-dehydratase
MRPQRPVLVTGGFGFLGSAFARRRLAEGLSVINVDIKTYAGDSRRLPPHPRLKTAAVDVATMEIVDLVRKMAPKVIVHFAAESHVTRSEKAEIAFLRTNVTGTRQVLQAAAEAGVELVVHVSTDEVYGPCYGAPFSERDKLRGEGNATSAYARSKALADDIALGFANQVPVIVMRPTNCIGPWQHPEKAVPRWITRALRGKDLPVWGDGGQVRDWMFVDDACRGIEVAIESGSPGEAYNLGPQGEQRTNLNVAATVARHAGVGKHRVYLAAYDRPQHDHRYAIDSSKLRSLGWQPRTSFESAIEQTVAWYSRNHAWWSPLINEAESIYSDSARASSSSWR